MSILELKKEVGLLKSFAISVLGDDKEGNYRPEFVKETLKAVSEKSSGSFANKKSFLRTLRK